MVRLTDIDITNQAEVETALMALYGLSKQFNANLKFCLYDEIKAKETLYLQQIDELRIHIEKLESENKELLNKLNQSKSELSKFTIVPNLGKQLIYLTVSDMKLEETTIRSNAIYKAIATDKPGVYEYEFNEEDAQHIKLLKDWKVVINPYCDVEQTDNNANYIQRVDKGELKKNLNGFYDITEHKAKVKFIKR